MNPKRNEVLHNEMPDSDYPRKAPHDVRSLDWKEVIATRLDHIADDFPPFDVTVNCLGDIVTLPLFTGEQVKVSLSEGIQWDRKFSNQAASSVMYLFSLNLVGRLLSTFQKRNDTAALRLAVVAIESFMKYSSITSNQTAIGRINSGDHSAATRVRALIKFIQVMRDHPDADFTLLEKVCDCLKYWSDWLLDVKNFSKNNHGLMGAISLLHSAVQFGAAPYASAYLDVATNRIIELGRNSFDRDGLCNENTIGYHNFNLHLYRGLLKFCKHYELPDTLIVFLEDLIHRATKALEFCVWQDGSIPPIGDWPVYRAKIASQNVSRCFPESGFAVVKNNDLYLSLVCGARTEIHKHVDDSSVTLRFKNHDILIDGGSYTYDRVDPFRRCVESSFGHSGLSLRKFDGLLRGEFLKQFGPSCGKIEQFQENADGVRITCVYTVQNGKVSFIRKIFVRWPDEVAIVDSVETANFTDNSEAVQRFLFGPMLNVQFEGRDKLVLTSDDFFCTLFQLMDCDGDLYRGEDASIVRGWFSKQYKEILPTYGVDFVQKAQVNRFAKIIKLAKQYSTMRPVQTPTVSRFTTIIKLAKCASLSECSTAVREFAGVVDLLNPKRNEVPRNEIPDSDYPRQAPRDVRSLDWNEVIATRLDHIADDFRPFDRTVSCSGDTVALPLFTGEIIEVNLFHGVQWDKKFGTQAISSVMWLFSLAWIGRLLSTLQQRKDDGVLQIAVAALNSFFDYSKVPGCQLSMGKISSADHAAATRVRVLIKFIQVMRERPDADYVLLKRVCDCLKYWSDWLANPANYKANNHGLMSSIALLHSAVQFGTTAYASRYLEVATSRIIEHGENSFDRDGLCNENSVGYHNFNLQCYRRLLMFCKHYGLFETLITFLEELILRATKALEFCVWQDGSIPPIGDSDVHRVNIPSRNVSRCFPESGFAVVKNDDLYLSIQCGARREFHKQVDDSSMTLRFMNRDILIDGGSYLYDRTNRHRRCVESSLGHSGLFLKEFDGLLRSEFLKKYGSVSGKIERFEESVDGVRVKCVYSVRNGYAVFVRNIYVCWPDEVAIVDSVALRGVAVNSDAVQRFIFGQTLDVRFDEQNKLILTSDDFSCTLFQLLDCDRDLYRGEDASPVRGWFSKKYMEILPTYGVDFVQKAQVSRFTTIIKLAKCSSLSECSMAVREFIGGADPFLSPGVKLEAS